MKCRKCREAEAEDGKQWCAPCFSAAWDMLTAGAVARGVDIPAAKKEDR